MTGLQSPLPESLNAPGNGAVLQFLAGASAHSDVAVALLDSVAEMPGVSCYCPDIPGYGFCVAVRDTRIFAWARGMSAIGMRFYPDDHRAALAAGARDIPAAGSSWAEFRLFGEPPVALPDWMARAAAAAG